MIASITVLEEHMKFWLCSWPETIVNCLSWCLCPILYTSSRLAGRRWWI